MFRQNFSCSALLKDHKEALPIRGCHPLRHAFPDASGSLLNGHWPGPRSLVTTNGVSVDVLSSGYLDISVHRVCFPLRMTLRPGFPIRISADQCLLAAPHSFSQRVTSFIASQRQGIHQMPLRRLIRQKRKDICLTYMNTHISRFQSQAFCVNKYASLQNKSCNHTSISHDLGCLSLTLSNSHAAKPCSAT